MGCIMHVYLVDSDVIEEAIYSEDTELFEAIIADWSDDDGDDESSGNESDGDDEDWDDEGEDLDPEIALRALIDGGPFEEEYGRSYLEAYESICDHFGEYFCDITFHLGWQPKVNEAFAELGMELSMNHLLFGGACTCVFPAPDWGGDGCWTKEECAKALEQWEASDPAVRAALDPAVLKDVECHVGWLRESKRTGKDIYVVWG
ncbi:hypothetical protein ACL02S_11330 [Nocardia sp. 004]|uniref:DUF7691 family protein n=1 Tax=Nocardia sp. 004 TaxID=3385978 RepID=UPI0039A3F477